LRLELGQRDVRIGSRHLVSLLAPQFYRAATVQFVPSQ